MTNHHFHRDAYVAQALMAHRVGLVPTAAAALYLVDGIWRNRLPMMAHSLIGTSAP